MQNLINLNPTQNAAQKCLFKFIFRHGFRKNIVHNLKYSTVQCNKEINRIFKPMSHRALTKICREFHNTHSVLLRNDVNYLRMFGSIRPFHTSNTKRNTDKNEDKIPKNEKAEKFKMIFRKFIITIMIVMLALNNIYATMPKAGDSQPKSFISWNEFVYQMLAKGEVEEIIINAPHQLITIVVHDDAIIKGQRTMFKNYYMIYPDIEHFEERLRNVEKSFGVNIGEGVQVIYSRKFDNYIKITFILMILSLLYSIFKKIPSIKNPMDIFGNLKRAKFTLIDPIMKEGSTVRFADVGGLKEAKIEVMEFVDYLKNPEHYKALGAKVPRGVLLLGPPGCGKTLLAKAVATEANVPFLSMNGTDFMEVIGGIGAARVRDLFAEARKRAPCIVYIDEIDTIGKKRFMDTQHSEAELTLNQLLVEMDGLLSKQNVIILASTNRQEVLDKALLRPGRFDRHILIDLPTLEERKQIFDGYLSKIVLDDRVSKYSDYLAYLTPGCSGADIANVCNEAALHAASNMKKAVSGSDLLYAVDKTTGGLKKKTHAMTPYERRVNAYHESGHALVGWLLEHTDTIVKISVVPRTNMRTGYRQTIREKGDRYLLTKEELMEDICVLLGGRAAENLVFNQMSTGAEDDLETVTKLAYLQVQQYGMSPTVGLLSFPPADASEKGRKFYSTKLANLMDIEVRTIIAKAYKRTEQILKENKDKLAKLAEALLEKEELTYDDIVELIGPPPFEKKRSLEGKSDIQAFLAKSYENNRTS